MDYIQASERFNLDKYIIRLTDMDYLDILDSLNKEIRNVELIKIPARSQYKRDIEYLQMSYVSELKSLSFLLGQGIKPGGVKTEILQKFKPILEELVKKGQLKDLILKLIE